MSTNAENFKEWKIGIEKFKVGTNKKVILMIKKVAFEIYKRVLMKTPVDKGLLRGGWTLSIGSPSDANSDRMRGYVGRKALFGGAQANFQNQLNEGLMHLSAMTSIQAVWLSNSMPYVETVEFGGYPKNPKRGTFVKASRGRAGRKRAGTGGWFIKSSGGFSKQAPKGMLGISVLEVVNWIKKQYLSQFDQGTRIDEG